MVYFLANFGLFYLTAYICFQCVEYWKGDGQMIRSGLILMIKDLARKGKHVREISKETGVVNILV